MGTYNDEQIGYAIDRAYDNGRESGINKVCVWLLDHVYDYCTYIDLEKLIHDIKKNCYE